LEDIKACDKKKIKDIKASGHKDHLPPEQFENEKHLVFLLIILKKMKSN